MHAADPRTDSRPRRRWVRATAGVGAILAALAFGAGSASAEIPPVAHWWRPVNTTAAPYTLQGPKWSVLGRTPIPSTPARPMAGDALPTIWGTLGNPTEIFLNNTNVPDQVLAVKDDSARWGAQVRTEPRDGSSGQRWRFQLMGWVGVMDEPVYASREGADRHLLPVYKIINYHENGTHTCLDANGNTGLAGSQVLADLCDPYDFNQLNQLWIAADSRLQAMLLDRNGMTLSSDPVGSNILNGMQLDQFLSDPKITSTWLMSLASLKNSGWDTLGAAVLSAGVENLQGYNSRVEIRNLDWPTAPANSSFKLNNIQTDGKPYCTGLVCLIDFEH